MAILGGNAKVEQVSGIDPFQTGLAAQHLRTVLSPVEMALSTTNT